MFAGNVISIGIAWGIIWLACVVWVAVDARRRGISPVFWPLVTLISGPLGLVAYGIVRELKKEH